MRLSFWALKGGDEMRLKLKTFRVSQNLTQDEMAAKIGCSRNSYQAIERGIRQGNMKFWCSLREVFNLSDVWEMMENEERKKNNSPAD